MGPAVLCLMGLVLTGSAHKPITIVAFGDSITSASRQKEEARWTTLVEARLQEAHPSRKVRLINAGVGGNTSREGLQRLDTDVLRHRPDVVIVQFGGNDATSDKDRHVPPEEYAATLETICRRLVSEARCRVILLTFPPIVDAWHGWREDPVIQAGGGPDACVEQYRRVTRDFAREHKLPVADIDKVIRKAIEESGPEPFVLPDGVHLTGRSNELVAEAVVGVLLADVPELRSPET